VGSHVTQQFFKDEFDDRWDELYERFSAAPIRLRMHYPGGLLGIAMVEQGSGPAEHAGTVRVHVRIAARGRGVGTSLLEGILDKADIRGLERLVATPYLPDDASGAWKVALFNRHGFTLEGIARKFARLEDGTFVDAALMARVR
jgi:L-amino acid N-acyltransferase YncA